MERYTIVGTQVMKFTTKDGDKIDGIRIYVTAPGNAYTKGLICDKFFFGSTKPEYTDLCSTDVPVDCEIEFSRKGSPTSCKLLTKGK